MLHDILVNVNYPALAERASCFIVPPRPRVEDPTGSTVPAQTDTRAGRGAPHGPSLRRLRTLTVYECHWNVSEGGVV